MVNGHSNKGMMKSGSTSRGFTLIELLVVIAIIAILAAILFPVFARARENARRASCQSNQKQIMLGLFQYSQDYDEKFVPLHNLSNPANPGGSTYWREIVQPYMKTQQIFVCPSGANGESVRTDMTRNHYGLNVTTSKYIPPPPGSPVPGVPLPVGVPANGFDYDGIAMASIQSTADLIVLADNSLEAKPNQTDGWGRGSIPGAAGYFSMWFDPTEARGYSSPTEVFGGDRKNMAGPDARHLGTVVCAFADGHVKSLQYSKVYAPPSTLNANGANKAWPLWYADAPSQ